MLETLDERWYISEYNYLCCYEAFEMKPKAKPRKFMPKAILSHYSQEMWGVVVPDTKINVYADRIIW